MYYAIRLTMYFEIHLLTRKMLIFYQNVCIDGPFIKPPHYFYRPMPIAAIIRLFLQIIQLDEYFLDWLYAQISNRVRSFL